MTVGQVEGHRSAEAWENTGAEEGVKRDLPDGGKCGGRTCDRKWETVTLLHPRLSTGDEVLILKVIVLCPLE